MRNTVAQSHTHTNSKISLYMATSVMLRTIIIVPLSCVGRVGRVWCGCAIEFVELGGRGFEENDIFFFTIF